MADRPLSDVLKSMVKDQTTTVGPVNNLLGTLAEVPVTGAISRVSEWRVYYVDSTATKDLLAPNDIVSRSIATELRSSSPIVRTTDGTITFTPSKPGTYLFATVVLAPQPFQFLASVAAANSTIGVFVDETLIRRGANKLDVTVGAYDPLVPLNVVVSGKMAPITITLPEDVNTAVRSFVPATPTWRPTLPIVTNYIDPKSGNTGNALFWGNQEKVGGWGVYNTTTVDIGVAKAVTIIDGSYMVLVDNTPAFGVKFSDTFTDSENTDLNLHAADFPTGEGWQTSGGNLMEIQGNEAVNIWAGTSAYVAQTDGAVGITYAIGDEIFADIEREATTDGYVQGFAFMSDGGNDYTVLFIENVSSTHIGFGGLQFGESVALDADDPDMPTVALAAGAKIRLGCTIIDGTHIEVWTEPAGGGTRTIYYLDATSNTDIEGHWVLAADWLDSSHDRTGLYTRAFGAPSQNACNKDNLTVRSVTYNQVPRVPALIQIETLSGVSELLGTVASATPNSDDTEIILTIDAALEFVDPEEVASGTVQILEFEHMHDVVRFASSEYVSFVDTNVLAGNEYSYTLDTFAPFDSSIRSNKAEIKTVTAGDVTAPGDINIISTDITGELLTLRYTTPADLDYLGTHVYYDNVASGTVDSLLIDYGTPSTDDSLVLTLVDSGTYYFVTFDQVGNEQDVYSGESFFWDGSVVAAANQPPQLIVQQLTSADTVTEGYDPLTNVIFQLDATDPDTVHDDLEINYLRIIDSGSWQTETGPNLPTKVVIPRGNKETWIRVRAYDGSLYSNELTFMSDFDSHPEISVVYDKFIVDSGVVFVNGSVDDDTKSLSWHISADFTGPQGSDPTSSAPFIVTPLSTTKTFNFQYDIDDGQRKVAVISPYGDEGASGTAGLIWTEDFVRPPRTLVFMNERTAKGAVSRTETLVTLSPIPSTARIFKKLEPAGGSDTFGTVGAAGVNTLVDGTQSWSTDRWNNYYDVKIVAGTGEGQIRTISDTAGTTLTVTPNWTTTPDTTSLYRIVEKFRLYSDNGTITSATTTSLTDTTKNWTPDTFKGKTLAILTGTDAGATREIASGTTDTLYFSLALSGLSASDKYKTDGPITISKDPLQNKILSFYADVPGIATEEAQSITIDADDIPELGALALSEPDAGLLKIEIPNRDDDAKSWAAYVRKSDWPTKTLTVSGTLDIEYMRFDGAIENAPLAFDVTSGEWFVMARPFDSYGTPGVVSADSLIVNNAAPTEGALIELWVDVIDSTHHRVYYSHNSIVESGQSKEDYKITITAQRDDTPPEYYEDVVILTEDRRTWQDSEDGNSLLNEDETTEAANSNTGQGSSVHQFDSGEKWATYTFTVKLYTDADVLVDTYTVDKSGYFTSIIPI